MNIEKLQDLYARVVVEVGVNIRPGQCLLINTGHGTYGFARALAKQAYKLGAKFVRIMVNDNYLTRYRLEEGRPEDWEWLPNYVLNESYEYLAEDWARIRIDNTEELDILKDLDPDGLSVLTSAGRKLLKKQQEALMRDEHSWCVVAAPGPAWARYIFSHSETDLPLQDLSDQALVEELWKRLSPILRLDKTDPSRAWYEHMAQLAKRSYQLNEHQFTGLKFQGPGTDLYVGLLPVSEWSGGNGKLPDGRPFLANIPTEEVFTTPDWRRTEGRVTVTRAVTVMENLVEGAWFEFKKGKVVDFGARKGATILDKFLNLDEGASSLGEIALVGAESPIFKSGLHFGSILFDENASCHMALGAGYPSCIRNSESLSSASDLKEAGCNVSLVHTDFMIGSPQITVLGINGKGEEIPIMQEGNFVGLFI